MAPAGTCCLTLGVPMVSLSPDAHLGRSEMGQCGGQEGFKNQKVGTIVSSSPSTGPDPSPGSPSVLTSSTPSHGAPSACGSHPGHLCPLVLLQTAPKGLQSRPLVCPQPRDSVWPGWGLPLPWQCSGLYSPGIPPPSSALLLLSQGLSFMGVKGRRVHPRSLHGQEDVAFSPRILINISSTPSWADFPVCQFHPCRDDCGMGSGGGGGIM